MEGLGEVHEVREQQRLEASSGHIVVEVYPLAQTLYKAVGRLDSGQHVQAVLRSLHQLCPRSVAVLRIQFVFPIHSQLVE